MRKWLILLSALSATSVSAAPAWTWVDADGQVHFSDRPVPGARQVELQGAQGCGPSPAPPALTAGAGPTGTAQAPYRAINIVSPAEQETLWNIGGNLNVQLQFEPPLAVGHRFYLALDGARRDLSTTNLRQTLPNVFRGAHTLQVVVIDAAGTELLRSSARNFVVQQASVQNPNSPLARPPGANAGN